LPYSKFDPFSATTRRLRASLTEMRLRYAVIVVSLALTMLRAFPTGDRSSAVLDFRDLREKIQQDRKRGDSRAALEHATELKKLLNGSPRSTLEVARAQLQLGHDDQAWREVEQFLAMGQASDLLTSKMFAGLHPPASSRSLADLMKNNQTAISSAKPVFTLADPELIAEDIDYDPVGKQFYVTSILEKKIIAIDGQGNVRDFAESPDHWPMLALKVDGKRSLLWATEVALSGFTVVPKPDWGRSEVLCYELVSRKLLFRVVPPGPLALGDMTLDESGDPIVSDSEGGGVYRVHDRRIERVDAGDFISPQTPSIVGDGKRVFIPDYVRGIGMLNLATRQVRWLSGDGRHALDGIDGLYFANGILLATQNGSSPERVIAFKVDASLGEVSGEQVIERSTPSLGDPTHGVVIGSDFYYIANSGWNRLNERGDWQANNQPSPAMIMKVSLTSLHAERISGRGEIPKPAVHSPSVTPGNRR